VTPSAVTTSQCHRDQGKRSIRCGTLVVMGGLDAPGMSNPITDQTWYDKRVPSALDDEYDFTCWRLFESLICSWLAPRCGTQRRLSRSSLQSVQPSPLSRSSSRGTSSTALPKWPVATRDGRREPRGKNAYSKQYVDQSTCRPGLWANRVQVRRHHACERPLHDRGAKKEFHEEFRPSISALEAEAS
jgi:hypothetical protein